MRSAFYVKVNSCYTAGQGAGPQMAQTIQERRLTAILSADVVGYSTLMSRDETATLAALRDIRHNLIDPKTAQHHGRTIKLMGDGSLMEFPSVVDAVKFAVDVQHHMMMRNESSDPGSRIAFRIGINIGDIIVQDDDIYGDGVNIAARLESLAVPGGICVSKTVVDHIAGKLDLSLTALGAQQVKNIPQPIKVYRVELDAKSRQLSTPVDSLQPAPRARRGWIALAGLATAAAAALLLAWQPWSTRFEPAQIARMALPLPDKPSLVVLPFADFSGDQGQSYFADGMTEDLITDLSKLSGIFVISRNSAWTYRGRAVKSQQVAEELGVQFILEGSVRRADGQVRVNAQLIDALAGHHIWAERYDAEDREVFALQDRVIREITAALAVRLTASEQASLGRAETSDPAAYDAVLRGLDLVRRGGAADVEAAIAAFNTAIELDPEYSRAHAGLAMAHWRIVQSTWLAAMGGGFDRSWRAMLTHLDKAQERPSALAHSIRAEMLVEQGRHDEAFAEVDKALSLAPNNPDIHAAKAKVLNATGRAAEAEAAVTYALRLDPHEATRYLQELGVAQLHQREYRDAAATMRRILSRGSVVMPDILTLISALGHLGETEQVPSLAERYNALALEAYYDPISAQEGHVWWYGDMFGYDRAYRHHFVEGLEKAGLPPSAGIDIDIEMVRALIDQREGLFYVRDVPRITTEEVATALDDGTATLVDVRAKLDFEYGHIPGSVNLSLPVALSRESLAAVAAEDRTVIFSCHGPHCPYSAYGAAKAKLWGWQDVRYYAGGFPAWTEDGHPVATGPAQ